MTYDTDEASEQDSEPRELYDLVYNAVTLRLTTANRDVLDGSNIYTATSGMRGEIGITASGNPKEMTLTLPIDHPLVRRYLQAGTPPQRITVTVRRKQMLSGAIDTIFLGEATSMSWDDEMTEATFHVPSRMHRVQLRVIPNVTVGRQCPHMLFDLMCGRLRTENFGAGAVYMVTTTVMLVDGANVRVDCSNVPAVNAERADFFQGGDLKHLASGERMTIRTQRDISPGLSTITDLTIQSPIVGMQVGDTVEVSAGCGKTITICNAKFANKNRFGGFPHLPTRNPMIPAGFGVAGNLP